MNSLTGFSYDSDEIIKAIAKKHTESDITLYGRKDQDLTTTIFTPTKFPDKISSLTDSISLSEFNIVGMTHLDRFLGEVLIALDLLNRNKGFIVKDNNTDSSQINRIIKGSVMSSYRQFEGSPMEILDDLNKIQGSIQRDSEAPVRVIIDHFFKVKSVGTVALGFVLSGILKKHQTLYLNPTGLQAQVRSIQMNDVDYDQAPAGSRVGLALKNVDVDDMERGYLLEERKIEPVDTMVGQVVYHRAVPDELKGDGEIFIAGNLRYQRGFLRGNEIQMDKPAIPNSEYLLVRPNSRPRIIGKIKVSS